MNLEKWSLSLNRDFLSNTELFFSEEVFPSENRITISDDEFRHLTKVLRKKRGEIIYVTDGKGAIYKGKIDELKKKHAILSLIETKYYKNRFANIIFYLPNLHNKERIRFAVEKLIELGITSIVIFNSSRTLSKGFNSEKWRKIGVAAIKQSLRAFMPNITFAENLIDANLKNPILFEQNAEQTIFEIKDKINDAETLSVLIGPEGGFDKNEINSISPKLILKLNDYRLRSETAAITAGALLTSLF